MEMQEAERVDMPDTNLQLEVGYDKQMYYFCLKTKPSKNQNPNAEKPGPVLSSEIQWHFFKLFSLLFSENQLTLKCINLKHIFRCSRSQVQ